MKKFMISVVLALCVALVTVLVACGGATVTEISVSKMPKIEYEVGETLDFSEGEITAKYSDGSTKVIKMTDPSVTIDPPGMSKAGEKNVAIFYQSKSTSFKITVSVAKLKVTFDNNYTGAPEGEVQKVEPGQKAVPPTAEPTREGYGFLGWYVDAGESSRFNFDNAVSESVTVYAHWGYAVEFNLNYDGATNTTANVEVNATVAEPANPTREGNIFTGWFTTEACTTVYDFNTPVAANTTVYAGWKAVAAGATLRTVKFNYNDGTGKAAVRQVEDGGKLVAKPADPVVDGGEFGGWYTDETYNTVFDINAAVSADLELYAKWNADSYTVTYHYNHADNDGIYTTQTGIASGGRTTAPAKPTLAGYYFAGWYTDAECEHAVDFNARVNSFLHYHAKWLKEWEFQAENTEFGNREAYGYSANGFGAGAFIMQNNAEEAGAHGGAWVANLHNQGLFVEFEIESDVEVFDAILVLRLSADFFDITLNQSNFGIIINGETIEYDFQAELTGAVSAADGGIMNKRPFDNWEFLRDVHLVKGKNVIRLAILDSKKYGEVGTMNATAPMIDSIYVNTNATLSWTPIKNI